MTNNGGDVIPSYTEHKRIMSWKTVEKAYENPQGEIVSQKTIY